MVKISFHSGCVFDLLVSVTETSELLLAGGVPHVEADGTVVSVEDHGVDFDTEGGDVLLLELTGEMSLDEGGLTDTTITDEDELVLSDNWSRLAFHCRFYSNNVWLSD